MKEKKDLEQILAEKEAKDKKDKKKKAQSKASATIAKKQVSYGIIS